MLGRKGQAFDAFKLLIAAVVAGAILVILLGMLGGFITPAGDPVNVMSQSISKVKGAPGAGSVSAQTVQFKEGDIVSATAVETKAGVNRGDVGFCAPEGESGACDSACKSGSNEYSFPDDFFTDSDTESVVADTDVSGKVRVYNCAKVDEDEPHYWIGFKAVS